MKQGHYYQKLLSLDKSYFGYSDNTKYYDSIEEAKEDCPAYNIKNQKELIYLLTTWCFDCDFEINIEGWLILEDIQKKFGKNVRDKVLRGLFYRQHDT